MYIGAVALACVVCGLGSWFLVVIYRRYIAQCKLKSVGFTTSSKRCVRTGPATAPCSRAANLADGNGMVDCTA